MIEYDGKGKGTIPAYTAPEGWEEVTTTQFLELAEWQRRGGSLPEKLEILTGVPVNTWIRERTKVVEGHIVFFAWSIYPYDWEGLPVPKSLEIEHKKVKTPKDFRELQFGATWAGESAVDMAIAHTEEDEESEGVEMVPEMVNDVMVKLASIAMCEGFYGDYDEEKAEKLRTKLLQLPAKDIMPLGFFYLLHLTKLVYSGRKHLATHLRAKSTPPG